MNKIYLAIAALLAFTLPAFAADEFGQRFSQNAPTSLSDGTAQEQADAAAVQNIEPAAGDEVAPVTPAETDPEAASDESDGDATPDAVAKDAAQDPVPPAAAATTEAAKVPLPETIPPAAGEDSIVPNGKAPPPPTEMIPAPDAATTIPGSENQGGAPADTTRY